MKPSMYKTFIRKVKNLQIVKPLYDLLYKRHMQRTYEALTGTVRATIKEKAEKFDRVELYMLTETLLNKPLMEVFPQAVPHYMEHGQGDYMYMLEKKLSGDFLCVFASSYKEFVSKRMRESSWVKPYLEQGDFERASLQFLEHYPAQSAIISNACDPKKENAVILLDAVEIYNVASSFWSELAEKCIAAVNDPANTHFIIKPHPAQSREAIEAIKKHFQKNGSSFTMLDQVELTNMSVEVIFALWKGKAKYALTIFSTSVYYISEFYPSTLKCGYSYSFMSKYTDNAPPQYKAHFNGLKDIVKEVLGAKCVEL
jgi:hypothetical protein